jgi:hypothetical protein
MPANWKSNSAKSVLYHQGGCGFRRSPNPPCGLSGLSEVIGASFAPTQSGQHKRNQRLGCDAVHAGSGKSGRRAQRAAPLDDYGHSPSGRVPPVGISLPTARH